MSISDVRQETLNKIVEIIEQEHNIEITENNKHHIMHVLNQMHGQSHRAGMTEGINVAKQFKEFQNNQV
ncbi:hypothetical protein [Pontibacillus sp. HMF3514]|uniref:hypothetical protein n=1 Tax=Pontibacillus sp. HMF3514 TaxID=2692425 RepID=UPI00131FBADA|nr:hypothetical protein [Pontibacillus sp. HMF3514]QHE53690.1 hypothetical protein GS400_17445 [Pontibacillus sp. HMF3514]